MSTMCCNLRVFDAALVPRKTPLPHGQSAVFSGKRQQQQPKKKRANINQLQDSGPETPRGSYPMPLLMGLQDHHRPRSCRILCPASECWCGVALICFGSTSASRSTINRSTVIKGDVTLASPLGGGRIGFGRCAATAAPVWV